MNIAMNDYQQLAKQTAKKSDTPELTLLNWTLGVAGEAGEFANKVKLWAFHKHGIVSHELAEELGDVLWYVANAADALGFTLNDIAAMNIEKLRQRYPEGFSEERSWSRE